jgi:hypothetical protein
LEAAQNAAQVARIEVEIARNVGCGRAIAVPDLVKHARLSQRERAVEPGGLQHAELLCVEAVEAAHRSNVLHIIQGGSGHAGSLGQIVDGVKYILPTS